jgi:hypothetical protein
VHPDGAFVKRDEYIALVREKGGDPFSIDPDEPVFWYVGMITQHSAT